LKPSANLEWLSFDDALASVALEPAFAHHKRDVLYWALDWLGDFDCDDDGYVAVSSFGLVYHKSVAEFLAAHELTVLCIVCGYVEAPESYTGHVDVGFVDWLTSSEPVVAPMCNRCCQAVRTFTSKIHGAGSGARLGNEAEYVAALHAVTRSSNFKSRVSASGYAWARLRFDPRRAPERSAA
jgi:hypothetical protein